MASSECQDATMCLALGWGLSRPTKLASVDRVTPLRERDVKTLAAVESMGWRALVIHECELKNMGRLCARVAEALRSASGSSDQTLAARRATSQLGG